MKQRIETKCPCCDKRIYVDIEVNHADIIDIMEEGRRKEAEELKKKEDELRAKDPEGFSRAQAMCDEIMRSITEGK